MDEFEVLIGKNHGGTFNSCFETISLSFEQFIKKSTKSYLGDKLLLDYRTSIRKCFEFLRGNRKRFIFYNDNGTEVTRRCEPPQSGMFTTEGYPPVLFQKKHYSQFPLIVSGGDFLDDLIEMRNGHIHCASLYLFIASFRAIKIAIGSTHILVFNPTTTTTTASGKKVMVMEQGAIVRDDNYLMHFRSIEVLPFFFRGLSIIS